MKTSENRKYIKIRGANEHNLKNIDVDIPRDEFVVLTGLSGSGKSSLAFDTIYAEGQRRYMESLSSYARQFLGQMEKPNVEKNRRAFSGKFPSIRKSTKPESEVNGRNGHGDLRLFPAALCKDRSTTLSKVWKRDQKNRRSIRWSDQINGAAGAY